jgi:hypothetical protein
MRRLVLRTRNRTANPVKRTEQPKRVPVKKPIEVPDPEYSDPEIEESDRPRPLESDKGSLYKLTHIPHYAEQIYRVQQIAETGMILSYDAFVATQSVTGVTHRNRSTVVSWLILVSHEWELSRQTLFNAVHCFDIILTRAGVEKGELQLLAAVCLWTCAKINEMQHPSIKDFRTQCRLNYKRGQFVEWEIYVFRELQFTMDYPTAQAFLGRFLESISAKPDMEAVAIFACETSLLSFEMNGFRPSVVALASILVGVGVLGQLQIFPIRTLVMRSHFTRMTGVLKCVVPLLELVGSALEMKDGAAYRRFIAGRPYEGQLECTPDVLQGIESLVATTESICICVSD